MPKVPVLRNCTGLKYPYTFKTADEISGIFKGIVTAGMYAWDIRAVVGIGKEMPTSARTTVT